MACPELTKLANLGSAALRVRWEQIYGRPPSSRISKDFMMLALGWVVQSKVQGGLSRQSREHLTKLTSGLKAGKELVLGSGSRGHLSPGVTLVREWHGTTHQVLVLEHGYGWQGKTWRSLSQIAREITGARWNGPAFFGLRSKSSGSGS